MESSILFRRPVSSGAACIACIWLVGVLIFLLFVQLSGNFHPVVAGEVYRSAQPTADQLQGYIRDHGIRSIINLRGREDDNWYREETAVAERLGVEHIDFKMSATNLVSTEQAEQLVAIMKSAPKPVLIHCRSGSDRTGIASAIYAHEISGIDETIAERQLSLYYGHIAIPYLSAAYAMDESWEKLSKHFEANERQAKNAAGASTARPSGVLVAAVRNDDGRDR